MGGESSQKISNDNQKIAKDNQKISKDSQRLTATQKNTKKEKTASKEPSAKPTVPQGLLCPHCGNQAKFNRRGHDKQGKQRWECGACKRSFVSPAFTILKI